MKRCLALLVILILSIPQICSADRNVILANDTLTASINCTSTGASLTLSHHNKSPFLCRQPLFAWNFSDQRGVVSSTDGWASVKSLTFKQTNGVKVVQLTFIKEAMEITSTLQLYPGAGPLRVSTSYKDLSDVPLKSPAESFNLLLTPKDTNDYNLLYVKKGTTNADLLWLNRESLSSNKEKVILCSGSDDRDDFDCFPWFCFQNKSKYGAYFGWEFSGYAKFTAKRSDAGIRFFGGLEPEKFTKKGSVDLPAWFVGLYTGDEDEGANQLHHWWMKYRFPKLNDPLYPRVHYNTWTSLGTAVNGQNCLGQIAVAKKLGAELFHIDAGWYKGVDEWVPDPKKFPNGLDKIADATHKAGMKFGLWTAPNHASMRLYSLHPDWVAYDWIVNTPEAREASNPDAFSAIPMCWGDKPCEDYITGELTRVIKDYKIDYLEHDQPIVLDCRQDARHTHHLGGGQYELVKAYYRTYDTLIKRFPGLILEDCMNGGHMMDYGLMQRFHVISITDCYGPIENRQAVWGGTYPMPPSYCEGYMQDTDQPYHYQFRSFMMGLWAMSADATKWSKVKIEACKKDIAAYKRNRPIIRDGNVYHVLPQPDGKHWDGLEYYHPQKGMGVFFVFRPDNNEPSKTVALKGLNAAAKYRVSFEDSKKSYISTGKNLMTHGVTIVLPQKYGSEIVYFKKLR